MDYNRIRKPGLWDTGLIFAMTFKSDIWRRCLYIHMTCVPAYDETYHASVSYEDTITRGGLLFLRNKVNTTIAFGGKEILQIVCIKCGIDISAQKCEKLNCILLTNCVWMWCVSVCQGWVGVLMGLGIILTHMSWHIQFCKIHFQTCHKINNSIVSYKTVDDQQNSYYIIGSCPKCYT